jgi:hypothetical protein
MKVQWLDEEIAIILMFDTWNIDHTLIVNLLNSRQYVAMRTVDSMRSRLARVRRDHEELTDENGKWIRNAVEEYIRSLIIDEAFILKLLEITKEEAHRMIQVRSQVQARSFDYF